LVASNSHTSPLFALIVLLLLELERRAGWVSLTLPEVCMSRTRRHFTPEQKAEIVRRHVAGKEPVSNLADEFGLQPSLIHGWVNQVLAQAERAFDRPSGTRRLEEAKERKIAQLETKLANKNEVIAELMQEHVELKKELGEL
jgi:transposase